MGKQIRSNKNVIFVLMFLIISICSSAWSGPTSLQESVTIRITGQGDAQTNSDFFDSFVAQYGSAVSVLESDSVTLVQMPFELYIKGVVLAEMPDIGDMPNVSIQKEALKAQAVAARSFAQAVALRFYPGPTHNYLRDDASGQAFLLYVPGIRNYDPVIGQAVEDSAGQAVKSFNRKTNQDEIVMGFFGNLFGNQYIDGNYYSSDEITYENNPTFPNSSTFPGFWNFPPYLKSRQEIEPSQVLANGSHQTVAQGNDFGLSQQGAKSLAAGLTGINWDYRGIINYYYSTNPSVVRAVEIYQQNGSTPILKYSAQWDDVSASGAPCTNIDGMNICALPDRRDLAILQNDSISAGTTAIIFVTTNESIDTRQNLQVILGSGNASVTANGSWEAFNGGHFPSWQGSFVVPDTPGSNPINITGQGVSVYINPAPLEQPTPAIVSIVALDSNPSMPATLALATGPSAWYGYESGPDMNHVFQVVAGTPTATATPVFTSTPSMCQNGWCLAGTAPEVDDGYFTFGYHGKVFIISPGGPPASHELSNWSSMDGSQWALATGNPSYGYQSIPFGYTAETYRQLIISAGENPDTFRPQINVLGAFVFDDRMWVYTQRLFPGRMELWNSTDGVIWDFVTDITETNFLPINEGINAFGPGIVIAGGQPSGTNEFSTSSRLFDSDGHIVPGIFDPDETWPARGSPILYPFNGKMFLLGGNLDPGHHPAVFSTFKDIWSTTDGGQWIKRTDNAAWGGIIDEGRLFYTQPPVEFANQLWMLAGPLLNSSVVQPFIWTSTDGVDWGVVTSHAPDIGPLAATDRLWLVGESEIWYYQLAGTPTIIPTSVLSYTATPTPTETPTVTATPTPTATALVEDWQSPTEDAPFEARKNSQAVTYQNGLLVIGGEGSLLNDVWRTSNGAQWDELTPHAEFSGRYGHASFVFNGMIWVLGGFDGLSRNDVWNSMNGFSWTQASSTAAFGPRHFHTAVVFDDKIWVIGGTGDSNNPTHDVWYSSDGTNWQEATNSAPWAARYKHTSFVFDGKMWIVGGTDGTALFNDVWSSSDGVNWTQATASASFSPRGGHTSVVHGNFMYVIGGQDAGGYLNDLWYSFDGITWGRSPTTGATFSPRSGHSSAVFNNAIWVIAGDAGGTLKNDVWFAPPSGPTPTPTPPPFFTGSFCLQYAGNFQVQGQAFIAGSAFDANNDLYLTDFFNGVRVFDSQAVSQKAAWGHSVLASPIGIAVNSSADLVYVADEETARIYTFSRQGGLQFQFNGLPDGSTLREPVGLALDATGNLYVADGTSGKRVVKYNGANGTPITVIGSGVLSAPEGIAVDSAGNIYVGDSGTALVYKFNSQGELLLQWGAENLGEPLEIKFDSMNLDASGVLWVADIQNNRVLAFNTVGTLLGMIEGFQGQPLVAVDHYGNVYVPHRGGNLVEKFIPCGTPFTSTPTHTATITPTQAMTDTPSSTPSATSTFTPTETPTFTLTDTFSPTLTSTDTPTFTSSPTHTFTNTPTNTDTPTNTVTHTASPTASFTNTSTRTFTPTNTPTPVFTNTFTSTSTPTRTPTRTPSFTPTFTRTNTFTNTRTFTRTFTPTVTFTSTPTPALVCVGTLTSPKLNLQMGCFQRDSQQERLHVRITNWGTSPVTLKNLSLKMWVNESHLVNMQQWVQLGQICQANGTGCVNANNTGFTTSVAWMNGLCVVDATHKANQVITFTPNGNNQTIPANGGYWDGGFDLAIGRNNPLMDDNWADDYSKTSSCPGNVAEDNHFTLFYNGTLLREWTNATTADAQTGAQPCCSQGSGGSMMAAVVGGPGDNEEKLSGLIQSAVAGPNISRGGEPVKFFVKLNRPAQMTLSLLSISGEQVYATQVQGSQGLNTLLWEAENSAHQSVASGLYLYVLQVDDGTVKGNKTGKIVILR